MADLRKLLNLSEELDDKSTKLLLKAIKENNKEGFDYLEFLVSVKKLKDMDMDEITAMKSAYATASSFGLSKSSLVSSGQYYISVLRKEYEEFKSALQRQIEKKIIKPEERVVKLQKEYDSIDDQIAKLKQRKALLQGQVKDLQEKVASNRDSLTEREEKFNDTFNKIKVSIEEDITNIKDQL